MLNIDKNIAFPPGLHLIGLEGYTSPSDFLSDFGYERPLQQCPDSNFTIDPSDFVGDCYPLLISKTIEKEREERTKRLINAGAAVEAIMKEITGKEKYPAEGENLERILNMLRSESVLTDDQKRQLHAGEEIESFLQKIENKDHLILTEKNLDAVKKIIEDDSLNQHYIKVGKAVEEKVHIKDLESWSIYVSRYADAIKKCQSGEWTLH